MTRETSSSFEPIVVLLLNTAAVLFIQVRLGLLASSGNAEGKKIIIYNNKDYCSYVTNDRKDAREYTRNNQKQYQFYTFV